MSILPVEICRAEVTAEIVAAFAKGVPGSWMVLKIAALLLIVERQRPSWTDKIWGLTRISLNRWIRAANVDGLYGLCLKQSMEADSAATQTLVFC